MNIRRHFVHAVAIAGVLVSAAACATASTAPRSGNGSITVGVTTTGVGGRLMAFKVTVEPGGASGMVNPDAGIFTARNLPPGEYTIRLSELPPDCRAENGGQARVTLTTRRQSMTVRYVVACG